MSLKIVVWFLVFLTGRFSWEDGNGSINFYLSYKADLPSETTATAKRPRRCVTGILTTIGEIISNVKPNRQGISENFVLLGPKMNSMANKTAHYMPEKLK